MVESKTPKSERLYRIELCAFMRNEQSQHELGLLLNEGELGILDEQGQKVGGCWTWVRRSDFALDIGAILDRARNSL